MKEHVWKKGDWAEVYKDPSNQVVRLAGSKVRLESEVVDGMVDVAKFERDVRTGFGTLPVDCLRPFRAELANKPFHFGSQVWPGLAKVMEESGELVQVCAKLLATGGQTKHWEGSDLGVRLQEEIGDLLAAITFLQQHNLLDEAAILARATAKLDLFKKWHNEQ